jgi:hypothetical protein
MITRRQVAVVVADKHLVWRPQRLLTGFVTVNDVTVILAGGRMSTEKEGGYLRCIDPLI